MGLIISRTTCVLNKTTPLSGPFVNNYGKIFKWKYLNSFYLVVSFCEGFDVHFLSTITHARRLSTPLTI